MRPYGANKNFLDRKLPEIAGKIPCKNNICHICYKMARVFLTTTGLKCIQEFKLMAMFKLVNILLLVCIICFIYCSGIGAVVE